MFLTKVTLGCVHRWWWARGGAAMLSSSGPARQAKRHERAGCETQGGKATGQSRQRADVHAGRKGEEPTTGAGP